MALDMIACVFYVDPPYPSTEWNDTYGVVQDDREDTIRLLKAQRGRVAVSGYSDEWDAGVAPDGVWFTTTMINGENVRLDRMTVVWTNYEPDTQGALL